MKKYIFLLLFVLFIRNIYSQVTIGSGIPPANGALLDLKQKMADSSNANSDKGIIIPRVFLTDVNSLNDINSSDPINRPDETEHIGLLVYNVNKDISSTDDENGEGMYTWTGTKWLRINTASCPWYKVETQRSASKNTDNIYLTGAVSIGKNTLGNGLILDIKGNASVQGIVKVESAPAASDIADALIPPRMTSGELMAKDAAYDTSHDGAIVYITKIGDETRSLKTQNVNTTGHYYYDAYADPNQGAGLPDCGYLLKRHFL